MSLTRQDTRSLPALDVKTVLCLPAVQLLQLS